MTIKRDVRSQAILGFNRDVQGLTKVTRMGHSNKDAFYGRTSTMKLLVAEFVVAGEVFISSPLSLDTVGRDLWDTLDSVQCYTVRTSSRKCLGPQRLISKPLSSQILGVARFEGMVPWDFICELGLHAVVSVVNEGLACKLTTPVGNLGV